jgi:hypothetical protein
MNLAQMPLDQCNGRSHLVHEEPSMLCKSALAASTILIASAALTLAAHAAGPGYCSEYARSAVVQYRTYQSIPGCFQGSNLRWNPRYYQHFEWCLSTNVGTAEAERDGRIETLARCKARAGY